MKKLIALLLALVMVLSLCACGAKEEAPAAAPADDAAEAPAEEAAAGSVYYLNFKPEQDEAWQALAAEYTAATGVPVTVLTAASGTYEETLMAEMGKQEAPTMFQVNGPVGLANWIDYCYDMSDSELYSHLTSDAFALTEDGAVYGIAYVIESYGIIANKALLAEAGYAVEDITNFDALKTIVEDITARKDELGFAAFTASDMDSSSSWRFTGHVANLEYYWESVDAPEAWTACPAELTGAYMDNYRNLWDLMINNSTVAPSELATGGFDAQAEFANGEAVFYSQGNWEWSGLEGKGMKAEDLTMIPYYCGVEGEEMAGLNCGTENYWAVNGDASEEDIQATLDFMYWLVTDAEAAEMAVATFGAMPYKQAPASTNPFLANANEYASNGHYTMWWATNYQPNVDAYRAAVVSAMNEYNNNPSDETWATVETAFVDGWAVQYQAANG